MPRWPGRVVGLGACAAGETKQTDVSSGKFDGLKDIKVQRPVDQILRGMLAEE